MASQTGVIFRVSTFGESHGVSVGCCIDGCPAGLPLSVDMIQSELNRRRPGQNPFTSPRAELDLCRIVSGVEKGLTLGTPITILIDNGNAQPADYTESETAYRPGHADYTYDAKFGIRAASGGGRASARETIGRVAAGAVAKQLLQHVFGESIAAVAWVQRIAQIECSPESRPLTNSAVDTSDLRVPDARAESQMKELLTHLMNQGDTAGGLIRCCVRGVPPGWGEPVFDKLEADLAKAMLSLPASRSFEMGSGLAGTFLTGSAQNDSFAREPATGRIVTRTNNSGGVQGGISNGMELEFAVGFKPVSTIRTAQATVDANGNSHTLKISKGRHDPCVLPRAVPIVEAMTWLVLADHGLRALSNRVANLTTLSLSRAAESGAGKTP